MRPFQTAGPKTLDAFHYLHAANPHPPRNFTAITDAGWAPCACRATSQTDLRLSCPKLINASPHKGTRGPLQHNSSPLCFDVPPNNSTSEHSCSPGHCGCCVSFHLPGSLIPAAKCWSCSAQTSRVAVQANIASKDSRKVECNSFRAWVLSGAMISCLVCLLLHSYSVTAHPSS